MAIGAALAAAVIKDNSLTTLWPYAAVATVPGFLGMAFWPVIRKEWAQIIVILGWLCLAIVACLAIGFVPMAILFLCAPAAAALFEKEKVIESMFLAAVFAALIYYAGHQQNFTFMQSIASDLQSEWGRTAGVAGTIAFLIAVMYSAADASMIGYEPPSEMDAALLDALPGGVMRINADNNLSFASDTAHALFHLPSKRSRVVHASAVFPEEDSKYEFVDMINHTRRRQIVNQREFLIGREDGSVYNAEVTVSPIDHENVLVHIVDRTDTNRTIEMLTQAQNDAHKEAEDKSLFFAGVSHELRTPLNAIIGFSDMMRSRMFGPLPGKYAEYADMIHDSGQHMLDLIGDVLDMSKIDAGKYELDYSRFDIADVLRSSAKMIRPMADAAGVTLEMNITDADEEIIIEADRKAVRQILLNLMSNAVKFSNKGGRVIVHANSQDTDLHMTIEDFGVGMTEDDLKEIGRPFIQTSSSKTTDQRGSGLGLSLVKSFTEMHHGQFTMTSQLGKGSTASLTLPLSPPSTPIDDLGAPSANETFVDPQ